MHAYVLQPLSFERSTDRFNPLHMPCSRHAWCTLDNSRNITRVHEHDQGSQIRWTLVPVMGTIISHFRFCLVTRPTLSPCTRSICQSVTATPTPADAHAWRPCPRPERQRVASARYLSATMVEHCIVVPRRHHVDCCDVVGSAFCSATHGPKVALHCCLTPPTIGYQGSATWVSRGGTAASVHD